MSVRTLSQSIPQPFLRAAQLVRAELLRGGALGFFETLLRLLGVAWRYPAHRRWIGIVGGPTTRRILEIYPRIGLRHSSSYLFAGATWAQRLQMLCAHYAFLNRTLDAALFNQMIEGPGACLWQSVIDGHSMSVHLRGPCLESRHREGELALSFAMDQTSLATIAFSLVPAAALGCRLISARADSEMLIYVGQVQGQPGRFEVLRRATRYCQDVLPHDLLMSALAGVARAWQIEGLLGVPESLQLSAGSKERSPSRFDYDSFWRRYHAVPTGPGHAYVALPLFEKPIGQILAKHRGRSLLKRAFKERVAAASAAAMCQAQIGAETSDATHQP